jgi:outer membrane murein-binding lipoprotein Lpp
VNERTIRHNIRQLNAAIDRLSDSLEYAQETRNKRAMHEARVAIQRAKDIRWSYVSDLKRLARK